MAAVQSTDTKVLRRHAGFAACPAYSSGQASPDPTGIAELGIGNNNQLHVA